MLYNSCSQNSNNNSCSCAQPVNYCVSTNSGCSYTQATPVQTPSYSCIQPVNSNCSYPKPVKPVSCCMQMQNCSQPQPCMQPCIPPCMQPCIQPQPQPQPQPCYCWVSCLYKC